jgi:hypothetical protein
VGRRDGPAARVVLRALPRGVGLQQRRLRAVLGQPDLFPERLDAVSASSS